MLEFIKRALNYNGSMEFKPLNDEDLVANYQHCFVADHYRSELENKTVLDAGCWTGPLEKAFKEKNLNIDLMGIDENVEALEVIRKNFPDWKFLECQLVSHNNEFRKKYANYFDTIVFLDVIEHLPKRKEEDVLKFFYELLKPGGSLILSTMSSHIFNPIDPAWFFGHRHYSDKKIKKMLQNSGFQVEEFLKIGNLYWDLDILFLYIYKHILKKKYKTSNKMYKKIYNGLKTTKIPTRFYIRSRKK